MDHRVLQSFRRICSGLSRHKDEADSTCFNGTTEQGLPPLIQAQLAVAAMCGGNPRSLTHP